MLEIPFVAVGDAAVVVSGLVLGVGLDGFVEVGDGAVEVALALIGLTAVVVGGGKFGIELDRLAEVLDARSISPLAR